MSSTDPDFAAAATDFKRGGWITGALGTAGMLARMLMSDDVYPWVKWLRMMIAGGIVGVITYFALYGTDIPVIYKSVLGSVAGAIAPELLNKAKEVVNNYGKKKAKRK